MSKKQSPESPVKFVEGQPFKVKHKLIPVYLYASWPAIESILSNNELKATLPERCNDLYEMWPRFETSTQREQFMNSEKNKYRAMFCFSLTPNSSVMWGHYADRGRGGVLRFDFPVFKAKNIFESKTIGFHIGDEVSPYKIVNTDTKSEIVSFISFIMRKVQYHNIRPHQTPSLGKNSEYISILSTKGKDWKYEKEVRVVVGRNYDFSRVNNGNYYSDSLMRYLSGLAIGPRAEADDLYVRQVIKSLPFLHTKAWPMFDIKKSIHITEIDPVRYSVISGWKETNKHHFSQIPFIDEMTLIDNFAPLPAED